MRQLKRFKTEQGGTIGVLFGLLLVPTIMATGAAVDYGRAAAIRTSMQKAADAAAMTIARDLAKIPASEINTRARRIFDQTFSAYGNSTTITGFSLTKAERRIEITVSGLYKTSIMPVVGMDTIRIGTSSEVLWGQPDTEVALVIDNTGSMAADMSALKQASRDFMDVLFSYGTSTIRASVVPYVASVNPGRQNLPFSMVDAGGASKWHGQAFKSRIIGELIGCTPDPYAKPWTPSPGTGGPTPPPPPSEPGPRGADRQAGLQRLWQSFASVSQELFGITSAQAQVTPNTVLPYGGIYQGPGAPYVKNNEEGFVPTGFDYVRPCFLRNPARISHLDLFNRIPGARWKGCVEARPEPYDITEDAPSAGSPNTLFVPYFWPDEPGARDAKGYVNSYLDDGPLPRGRLERTITTPVDASVTGSTSVTLPAGTSVLSGPTLTTDPATGITLSTLRVRQEVAQGWRLGNDGQRLANLFKYDSKNQPTITESGPNSKGPNAGCPDELVRLTSDKSRLLNRINTLTHWNSGGTIISEGLMWGWRTLSPNAPFSDGKPYRQSKKFLVLMSDGINSLQENNRFGPTKTDYTAYGYLRDGRFGSDQYRDAEAYLDRRTAKACANVKDKDIVVFTVLYRENSTGARALMQDCASDTRKAFYAKSPQDLNAAFTAIAYEIINLRFSR